MERLEKQEELDRLKRREVKNLPAQYLERFQRPDEDQDGNGSKIIDYEEENNNRYDSLGMKERMEDREDSNSIDDEMAFDSKSENDKKVEKKIGY